MADLETEQRLDDLENRLNALLRIIELPNSINPPNTSYIPIYNPNTGIEEKITIESICGICGTTPPTTQALTFDSTLDTFDSTILTFDQT